MAQVLISEVIAALQAEMDKRGDVVVMQRLPYNPGEIQPMPELPFVTQVTAEGEFEAIVMRLP